MLINLSQQYIRNVPLDGINLGKVMGNRSLDRGITLLEVLSQSGSCSLAELHKKAKLPKPTICRMMETLIKRGLVRRSLVDKRYRMNIHISNNANRSLVGKHNELLDVVMPELVKLTEKVYWPASFHILNGQYLDIIDGTDRISPFGMRNTVIDLKVNIFNSATGMACLMAMSDAEIMGLHVINKTDDRWGIGRLNLSIAKFIEKINIGRKKGYGYRVAKYQTIRADDDDELNDKLNIYDDGLLAIAVAIKQKNKVVGAINLYWPKTYKTNTGFAKLYLADLKLSAEVINVKLAHPATNN